MADINKIIDSLSDEELDTLNSDPELLKAFKAKYATIPGKQAEDFRPESSSLPPMSEEGLQQPELDPIQLGVALGPSVGKLGAKIASSGAEAVGGAAAKGGRILKSLISSPKAAEARTLSLLEQKGLKDIPPTVFNKGENEAMVGYAEKISDLAKKGGLNSQQLQEARATLKDILDNHIRPNSPTGQTISRAKDVVTQRFRELNPDISAAFDQAALAQKGAALRGLIGQIPEKLPIVGPVIRQGKKIAGAIKNI